jgi:hypothetical protein
MATNYEVNYEDERFDQVEQDKEEAMSDLEQTYGDMIDETDSYYDAQIEASKDWAEQQSQLQQEQTDFTIEQIEQQKEQQRQDYLKEQSGAYVDWQKQSNRYGTEAERQASAGLNGTGFSESSQVSMYNTYQNRVATARESYTRAVLNYDNAIKDARLQNNAALAEIAYQALQTQLELSLQGFQYKNQLILEQANKKLELDNTYYNRYMDVLNQINHENAMAEEIRQFEENYKLQQEQLGLQRQELEENIRQFNQNYDLKVKEFNEGIRQFNEEIARLKAKDAQEYELEIKQLEMQKQQMEENKRQWEAEMELKRDQLTEQQRQFDKQMSYKSSSSGGGGGGGTPTATYKIEQQTSTGNSSNPPVDQQSILDLGYGPISMGTLTGLIRAGKVTYYMKDGKVHFRKISSKSAGTTSKIDSPIPYVAEQDDYLTQRPGSRSYGANGTSVLMNGNKKK